MSKSTSFYIYVFFPAERQRGETAALYLTGIEVKISFEKLEGYSISFKHMAYGEQKAYPLRENRLTKHELLVESNDLLVDCSNFSVSLPQIINHKPIKLK